MAKPNQFSGILAPAIARDLPAGHPPGGSTGKLSPTKPGKESARKRTAMWPHQTRITRQEAAQASCHAKLENPLGAAHYQIKLELIHHLAAKASGQTKPE
jgi:hypothetical protein